jgi:DNA-binding NarL/FixJ family response regulator
MIRLLIVEDQALVSKGMQMRLSVEPDFFVIGETANSEEALALATSLCPDVVLIDVDMPQVDGIELARKLNKYCPYSSVIFLSMQDDVITFEKAAEAGVVAVVGKFMPADTLMAQIRQTCRNN